MIRVSASSSFRLEGGQTVKDEDESSSEEMYTDHSDVVDELFKLSDTDYKFYKNLFFEKEHLNFLCSDSPNGPLAVSIVRDASSGDAEEYLAIIRTAAKTERKRIAVNDVRASFLRRLFRLGPSPGETLKSIDDSLPRSSLSPNTNPRLPSALLDFDLKQLSKGFKFGVLYCGPGQTKEDEMFSNVDASPEFEEFLNIIGDRIELTGWDRYRGGLDVQTGATGTHSYYVQFQTHEIMFHVSTLLPFNSQDPQQLERKRHIGNDIVVIVFKEGDQVYRPSTISARMVHIVVVISPVEVDGQKMYSIAVVSRAGVPRFAPDLPENGLLRRNEEFRGYLLTKLLNAEQACLKSEDIKDRLTRTRSALLRHIAEEFKS